MISQGVKQKDIALKYDNTVNQAPIVVAKGADYLAFKIKDIARHSLLSYSSISSNLHRLCHEGFVEKIKVINKHFSKSTISIIDENIKNKVIDFKR